MELTLEQALQKGIEAHKAGKVQEANQLYNAILKANPKHPDANHNMGVLAVGIGKVEQSLPFFMTALESNADIAQYWLSYINALIKLDRRDDAKAVLEQAKSSKAKSDGFNQLEKQLGSSPPKGSNVNEPPSDQFQILVNQYNKGQYKEAFEKGSQLLEQFPNSINLYNITGVASQCLGKLEEAIDAYRKAIAIEPDYADAFYNLGNALKEQGKADGAAEAYNKALSIKPDYADAHYNLGNILQKQGKLEEAIKAYTKALSIKPDYADAYNNMGNVLQAQCKLEKAIEAYTKALSIEPDDAEAYNNIGNILQEQGKLEEAIEAYTKAISIKPDYADAYNNLGVSLKEQDMLEEAIKAYNKALSIKPDYADAYNNLGVSLKDQGKLKDAIDAYNKALCIEPDSAMASENASALIPQIMDTALMTKEFETSLDMNNVYLIEMPKFQIYQAIRAFLFCDQKLVLKHLKNYKNCTQYSIAKLIPLDQVFCSAYNHFLQKLVEKPLENEATISDEQTLFHIGESHCLSYAHRLIKIHGTNYKIKPKITFGAKAYHFSIKNEDAYKAITKANFNCLPDSSKVFISFGEIDCRPNEGFISAAKKHKKLIENLVSDSVRGYVDWFAEQNKSNNHNLFFFNVPAPIYNEKYSLEVNREVTRIIKLFNNLLHKSVADHDFTMIDVYKFTVGENGFSNGLFHIDNYHLSSDAIPEIEKQIGTFS